MNPRFLKQKPSGYIYPWTAALAARPDMEPYEPPKPEPKPEPEPEPAPKPEPPRPKLVMPPRPPKQLVRKTTDEQAVALFTPPQTETQTGLA
jgi:hypothetical protein